MSNKTIILLISCIAYFTFLSCKKVPIAVYETNENFSIEEAQTYFNSQFSIIEPFSNSSVIYSSKTKREPLNWENAKIYDDIDYYIVQVPLSNSQRISLKDNKTTPSETLLNLLLLKNKMTGDIFTAIMA